MTLKKMPKAQVLTLRQQLVENPVWIELLAFVEGKLEAMRSGYFDLPDEGEDLKKIITNREEHFLKIRHWQELMHLIKTKVKNTGKETNK